MLQPHITNLRAADVKHGKIRHTFHNVQTFVADLCFTQSKLNQFGQGFERFNTVISAIGSIEDENFQLRQYAELLDARIGYLGFFQIERN